MSSPADDSRSAKKTFKRKVVVVEDSDSGSDIIDETFDREKQQASWNAGKKQKLADGKTKASENITINLVDEEEDSPAPVREENNFQGVPPAAETDTHGLTDKLVSPAVSNGGSAEGSDDAQTGEEGDEEEDEDEEESSEEDDEEEDDSDDGDAAAFIDPYFREDTSITVQYEDVNAHLSCTKCFGYLREARALFDCGHTFCTQCLVKHFEENLKSELKYFTCPELNCQHKMTCTNPIVTCSMEDRHLQQLVDIICPKFAESDAVDRNARETDAMSSSSSSLSSSSNSSSRPAAADSKQMVVELAPLTHNGSPLLSRPLLVVPVTTKLSVIKKYMVKTLKVDFEGIVIFIKGQRILENCDDDMRFLRQTRWISSTHLVLQFTTS